MSDQIDVDSELDELIEQRIKTASTETKSDDPVVQIAWLADGIQVWHSSNGKRGHGPAETRRYIISSISRLIASQRKEAELAGRIDEWRKLVKREPSMWNVAGIIDRGNHDYKQLWWKYQQKAMRQSGYYTTRIQELRLAQANIDKEDK